MTSDEKLIAIKRWTDEFTIRTLANGTVKCGTKLNKWSSPFSVTFANERECINARYSMTHHRVFQLCQHINTTKKDRGSPDTVGQ
jgi:hypothetical protein